jgi:patatin-related protein
VKKKGLTEMTTSDQPTSQTTAATIAAATNVAYTQEIRFAVVMYGGVSLAIYINGVAQELLKLVRATAPRPGSQDRYAQWNDDDLHGSERVYRMLGRMLAHGERPTTLANPACPIHTRFVVDVLSGTSAGGINAIYLAKALANDQDFSSLKELWIKEGHIGALINDNLSLQTTRLAAQTPPLSLLNSRRMYWKLLDAIDGMDSQNDSRKAGPSPLDAIDGMDSQNDNQNASPSPNVEELDLYITATDTQGQIIPIKLADGLATERRHRNVFHFRYSNACFDEHQHRGQRIHNDFKRENNPFLAFAARCTSAFPVAFEPMSLRAIDEVLRLRQNYGDKPIDIEQADWRPFYAHYSSEDHFVDRPFSDGGVLDNYPFSYASNALPSRSATRPVDRKLLYIEPAPENPSDDGRRPEPPDFLRNAWLSLSTLPRYETIRDDLQEVLKRNRLIERVERIIVGMENDLVERELSTSAPFRRSAPNFDAMDLRDMVRLRGRGWIGYQRLRVAETTDELAWLITRVHGYDRESRQFLAIRNIVRYWRDQTYTLLKTKDEATMPTLNSFLFNFDLEWRLRRLNFMSTKIDELLLLAAPSGARINSSSTGEPTDPLWQRWDVIQHYADSELFAPDDHAAQVDRHPTLELFRDRLRRVKQQLSDATILLRQCRAYLRSGDLSRSLPEVLNGWGVDDTMRATIKSWAIESTRDTPRAQQTEEGWKKLEQLIEQELSLAALLKLDATTVKPADVSAQLDAIIAAPDDMALEALLKEHFAPWKKQIDALIQYLIALFIPVLSEARRLCDFYLPAQKAGDGAATPWSSASMSQAQGAADIKVEPPFVGPPVEDVLVLDSVAAFTRRIVRYYFDNFEDFDMTRYPIFYATQVGDEIDPVEVFRISPQDAPPPAAKQAGFQKLAGNQLGNFGAFFKETFRTNDILWGQLDGAERIITALLPGADQKDIRDELIKQAHCAILAEEVFAKELGYKEKHQIRQFVDQAMAEIEHGTAEQHRQALATAFNAILATSPLSDKTWPLQTYLDGQNPVDHFYKHYKVDRAFDPVETVRFAARASKVFGLMLESHALAQRLSGNRMIWITRLAQLFWTLVEVLIPDSVPNLIFHHWLKLLYFFEALMLVLGTLLLNQTIQQFGFIAFLVTITVHGAVLFLGDWLAVAEHRAMQDAQADGSRVARVRRSVADFFKSFSLAAAALKCLMVAFLTITSGLGLMVLLTAAGIKNFTLIQDMISTETSGAQQWEPTTVIAVVAVACALALWFDFADAIRRAWSTPGRFWFAATTRLLGVAAPLAGLIILALAANAAFLSIHQLPAGFSIPTIALEWVEDVNQLRQIIESYGGAPAILRDLRVDTVVIVPVYCFLYGALALLLLLGAKEPTVRQSWRRFRQAPKDTEEYQAALKNLQFAIAWLVGKVAGALLLVCVIGAGMFDWRENERIAIAVATLDQQAVSAIREAAFVKWVLFCAIMICLGAAFLAHRGAVRILGIVYLAVAASGILGLLVDGRLLELFFGLIGLALIPTGAAIWEIAIQARRQTAT